MKKIISIITAMLLIVSSQVCFASVNHGEALKDLQNLHIMVGFQDGQLHENENVTRSQAAAMIMRTLGFDDSKWYRSSVKKFNDMPLSNWASGYVYKASSLGIVDGMSEEVFSPDSNVTYEQAVKMLIELLGYTGEKELIYPDGYIAEASEKGLLKDVDGEKGIPLTRGQLAQLIHNALAAELYKVDNSDPTVTLMQKFKEKTFGMSADSNSVDYSIPVRSSIDYDNRYKYLLTEDTAGEGSAYPEEAAVVSGGSGGTASSPSPSSSASPEVSYDADMPVDPGIIAPDPSEPIPMPLPGEQEQITAGQLTAGSWKDVDNWEFWRKLMSDSNYFDMQSRWEIPVEKYEVVVKDRDSSVIDCLVSVESTDGSSIWTSRTDKDGRAFVFLSGDSSDQQQNEYNLVVSIGEETYTMENVQFDAEKVVSAEIAASEPEDILDLMFMIDTTGSMSDELQYINEELKDVVSQLDTHVRVSCNYYRDTTDAYTIKPFDFTTNIDTVISQISLQYASGGGDYEEAVDLALLNAVSEHEWSESAKSRLLFLVLDAPPHFTPEIVTNINTAVKSASEKGIHIIPVASSGVDKNTEFFLRSLAIATNGTYIFLTDDSGIGYSHIEPTVGDYDVEYLNELILKTINEYI